MKGMGSFGHNEKDLDGMILYSNNYYFDRHLEVLEKVIEENPSIMETFGTPICTGAMVKNENERFLYTIAAGIPCRDRRFGAGTYNDYIDKTINDTYVCACAKLIKQYFPIVSKEYRELDPKIVEKVERLSNFKDVSAEEFVVIRGIGNTEIRELAYKIVQEKQKSGNDKEKEDVMNKLKNNFVEVFKPMCSIHKFLDKEHTDVPIYQDEPFLEFVKEQEKDKKDKISIDSAVKNAIRKGTTLEKIENVKKQEGKLLNQKASKEEK